MIREIHSPSKFSLTITTKRDGEEHDGGRMRPCQQAMIGRRPDATIASRCSIPSTVQE